MVKTILLDKLSMLKINELRILSLVIFLFVNGMVYGQKEAPVWPFITLKDKGEAFGKITDRQAMPLPAGHTLQLDYNMIKHGRWTSLEQGFVWNLGFTLPGAPGMNVYFRNVHLSETDTLLVYAPDGRNHPEIKTFADNDISSGTGFLPGDSLIVELHTQREIIPFELAETGIANDTYSHSSRDFGDAGGCEVPVNCEEGRDWQSEKDGVARILVKEATNLFWCTGSLVNNTNNDGKPYFLTANHCGENAGDFDYRAWVFYFNYESDDCGFPTTEPDISHKVIGARLLAHSHNNTDGAADFKLLLLNRHIPEEYHPYFNGWDRSGNISVSGVTIHHPGGDIKMISTYTEAVVSASFDNGQPDEEGMYWQVHWDETDNGYGVTEGGSSGSPLFNSDGYVIGALTGGNASCTYPDKSDYYGKLYYAWESEGEDSTSQLKYWLDPLESGVVLLKGTNLDTTMARANFSCDGTEITMGEQVQFVNYSTGNITGYEWHFEGGNPSVSEQETPLPVRYDTFGSFDVTLIARSANGNDTLRIPNYIRVLPMMVPNPSAKGVFRMSFGKEMPAHIEISVYDVFGRKISPVFLQEQNGSLYVDISTQAAGIYLISVKTDNNSSMLKAFYVKKKD